MVSQQVQSAAHNFTTADNSYKNFICLSSKMISEGEISVKHGDKTESFAFSSQNFLIDLITYTIVSSDNSMEGCVPLG